MGKQNGIWEHSPGHTIYRLVLREGIVLAVHQEGEHAWRGSFNDTHLSSVYTTSFAAKVAVMEFAGSRLRAALKRLQQAMEEL